jgi:hypothetical protein
MKQKQNKPNQSNAHFKAATIEIKEVEGGAGP